MAAKTLILAALPEEADAVFPDEGERSRIGPFDCRAVGDILIATCGLGKVNAALAVGKLVTPETRLVAMTGTCGRIGAIDGDCFWISTAIQHDYGARGTGGFTHYRAGDWPMGDGRDHAFTAMPDPGSGLLHARMLSGDVFLECPDTASGLAGRLNAHLIDMEVAAVAQAAEALGLPWCAIKAVTDEADGGSAGDFSANLRRAARKAGMAMEAVVSLTLPTNNPTALA
ncbi:purine phosphorylase [Sphingorhabdus sp.]|jgi:adenosylhomocysteine nucleosidase|uniref:5'-methylthioadenosine/S-adenosylhomocysteine nucleosidase family protein n=1 Tax=Sphingorhabdus sp. TaxID=1902408 RepID=UPI003BB12B53|nr:purine phosphorylase [Sphingomonadales bacterium]MBK9432075.1 purine phosphorylase [Sphingomonadales bacterium]MBL0023399.1 purine phosphorylase [Sphingomonadales bacterium]